MLQSCKQVSPCVQNWDVLLPYISPVCAEGKAKLIDRHTVEVALAGGGTRRLTTKHILLAQGGTPVRADVPGKVFHQLLLASAIRLVSTHVSACASHTLLLRSLLSFESAS